jgi:hypothetical protein
MSNMCLIVLIIYLEHIRCLTAEERSAECALMCLKVVDVTGSYF